MATRLKITDLDFDTIKTNLKTFLNQQSEFSDYDFDGSSLSVLIDLLAYNTHYNAYYLNMIANESFLDTALLRDSVVSHAKILNYVPASKNAPIATVNIVIETDNTTLDTYTLNRGTKFTSELIDDTVYNFVNVENYTVTKSNTKYILENVDLYEGVINSYIFDLDISSNPKQIFVLPDSDIDTRTLKVSVRPSKTSSIYTNYLLATDVLDYDSSSKVFYLQEGKNDKFEIYFGDDYISKKLDDGSEITVSYLVTNGDLANKANNFVNSQSLGGSPTWTVTTTTVNAASGGSEKESVDSIKFSAPKRYSTQNRLVTAKDYASYLKSNYPGIQSISVWGGDEQTPVVYNKTFISIKMKGGYYLSETEKTRIIDNIIKPKAVITTEAEIIDPEYLYILVIGNVQYDASKTNESKNKLFDKVKDTINNYNSTNLETFNSRYIQSRLQDEIDNTDTSFIGSVISTKVQKRIEPKLNQLTQYTVDFGIEIKRGSINDNFVSSYFNILDPQGVQREVRFEEIPYSATGVEVIQLINPGYGYKQTPEINIIGDGTGATARAVIKNGSIDRIEVINPGINYTKAKVVITSETGYSGSAIVDLQASRGRVRLVYYNENSDAIVLDSNAGIIYYTKGLIELTKSVNILSTSDSDGIIRFTAFAQDSIINSKRNLIVLIDPDSSDSVSIDLKAI